MTEIACYCRD